MDVSWEVPSMFKAKEVIKLKQTSILFKSHSSTILSNTVVIISRRSRKVKFE